MTETLVREYYTEAVRKEWRRLVRDAYHGLEYRTTLHFLEAICPRKDWFWMQAVGREDTRLNWQEGDMRSCCWT